MKEICINNNVTCQLTSEHQSQVNDLLNQIFNDLFSVMPYKTNLAIHKIRLTPDARPRRFPSYRMNPQKSDWFKKELDEWLSARIITECDSE